MADVSAWLAGRRLGPGDVERGAGGAVLDRRLRGPGAFGCARRGRCDPLLEYLRGLGVAPLARRRCR